MSKPLCFLHCETQDPAYPSMPQVGVKAMEEEWYFQDYLEEGQGWGQHTGYSGTWIPRGLAKYFSLEKAGWGRISGTKRTQWNKGPLGEKCSLPAGSPENGGSALQCEAPWLSTLGYDCGGGGPESQTRASLVVLASPLALLPCILGHLSPTPPLPIKGGAPRPCCLFCPLCYLEVA